jgi:hypothetical protein
MAKKINMQRLNKLQVSEDLDFCERNWKKENYNLVFASGQPLTFLDRCMQGSGCYC